MWYIFLKSKLYENSKNCFLKIFSLHPSPLPLRPVSFEWSILEKNGNYFSILEGVYFLHFFPKTPLSASKQLRTAFLPLNLQKGLKVDIFKEIAILRHGGLGCNAKIFNCHIIWSSTRTTIVVSNGRYTFYQIPFIKYHLSNTFIKYHLSNTFY